MIEKGIGKPIAYSYTLLQMARIYPFIAKKHQDQFAQMMELQSKNIIDTEFFDYLNSTYISGSTGRNFPLNIMEANTNNVSEAIFSVYSRNFPKVPTPFDFFRFLAHQIKTQIDFRNLRKKKDVEISIDYLTFMQRISSEYQSEDEFEKVICSIFKFQIGKDQEFETDDELNDDIFTQIKTKRINVSNKEFMQDSKHVIKRDPLGNKLKVKGPRIKKRKFSNN